MGTAGQPTEAQRARFISLNSPWWPQEGPQEAAFLSEADVTLYGGAAGGGKTALAAGLAMTRHRETLFVRRHAGELTAVCDYLNQTFDTNHAFDKEKGFLIPAWDGIRRRVRWFSCPHPGNETKEQGKAKDLLVVDEAANMLEHQVRFLMGWVRSSVAGQRCRTLLCSNPPTTAEGLWLVLMFEPWLDPTHPNPAKPGELRWYAMIDGSEVERPNGEPFEHDGETITPQSRTFIPARVTDNAYLRDTGYVATLQALPEPLRSQMLYGDFTAGQDDDEWQVIPSAWVRQAMKRWEERELVPGQVTSAGLDPSRGGRDQTVLAMREGWYFHRLRRWEGHKVDTGGKVAAKTVELIGESNCPVHTDVIGIGASAYDHLAALIGNRAVAFNAAERNQDARDITGMLKFANERARVWWQFRDLLNPANGKKIALPPDQQLLSELCTPTYHLAPTGIQVESKKDIIKRLGRSTDSADAVITCAEKAAAMNIIGTTSQPVRVVTSR